MRELYDFKVDDVRVIVAKPTPREKEIGEMFYAQKFNKLISEGFFTRAMMSKKFGDIGGVADEESTKEVIKQYSEILNSSKTIEFFGGSEDLDEEEKERLKNAQETLVKAQKSLLEYEQHIAQQFSFTADHQAEKMFLEWLVLNFSFYEDENGEKKEIFPLFPGETFEEKKDSYYEIIDDESENQSLKTQKEVFEKARDTIVNVITIYQSGMAETKEGIKEKLKEFE